MDATLPQKKLDFKNIRPKLYGAKAGIFETSGKIKKVWALSCFFSPGLSAIHSTYTGATGFTKTRFGQAFSRFIEADLFLLIIKDKRI